MSWKTVPYTSDDNPLRLMNPWKFILLQLARRPANEMFHRVVCRAYERSVINSTQLHELCGIWNRLVNGIGPEEGRE